MKPFKITLITCALLAVGTLGSAWAQDAVIRKNIAERVPQLKTINEINKTPIPGIFELRINDTDIYYTDAQGNYLIHGNLFDTKQQRNLTEERVNKITAINFDALPLKDAFTIVRGNGKRKLAVFEDPNCGYCKQFEEGLQRIDNVTIHMFLYPILRNGDSAEKSRNIWCAKDKTKAWQAWMLNDVTPATASCNTTAIDRNLEFGKKYKLNGTPTLVFANGQRVPGAIGPDQVEQLLNQPGS